MRKRNRRRNPDMEAYRDWQSDRNDRGALQRYLLSMDRGREVMSEPEDIIDLESRLEPNDPLRQVYDRVRPDYSDEATSFRKERWQTLVDRYAGRQLDPRAIMILVEMGLRSGLSLSDTYSILHKKKIVNDSVYEKIDDIQYSEYEDTRLSALDNIGPSVALAIPQIIDSLKNDPCYYIRSRCVTIIASNGSVRLAVPLLVDSLKNDQHEIVRYCCAMALEEIGPSAALAVPQLIDSLKNDEDWFVNYSCAKALGSIGQAAWSAVSQLADSPQNSYDPIRTNYIREACRIAIERITGERP